MQIITYEHFGAAIFPRGLAFAAFASFDDA